MSMRTLAETLHISRANAYARVERLRESGVIRGFRADIDPVASGLGTSAYVTLNVRQADWREVREHAARPARGRAHRPGRRRVRRDPAGPRPRQRRPAAGWCSTRSRGMPGVVNTRTLLVFEEHSPRHALLSD